MKAGHDQTQIAKLLDRHKSTISRKLSRNRGPKGYRPKQACATTTKRSEKSRYAATMPSWVAEQAACLLKLQWSPEQIEVKLPVSHEALYQPVYSDKARGGTLWVIVKVAHKTSYLVSRAIVEELQPFANRVKTLTYDNDKEFAAHIQIDQALNSTGYFARPFASWERGSNENFNGLLRQYVPKKRFINTVGEDEITMIQNRLNNRPRKRLGFKTAAEVFNQSL